MRRSACYRFKPPGSGSCSGSHHGRERQDWMGVLSDRIGRRASRTQTASSLSREVVESWGGQLSPSRCIWPSCKPTLPWGTHPSCPTGCQGAWEEALSKFPYPYRWDLGLSLCVE
ncbi:hypothetical protein CONLIGDRAFT_216516 [Coniochaeta ligniaria NRRL 30616]|uniref:Uncharacterized protein n=1 Tax=Coniochaeta ligniaria NRRL 30616 TaxID=1408157 RepID=A0A1J7I5D4_9PEZI|nr:hypothetical protein CONLIGDRAFT_216516 [Coniochaeta ligniaria NRRL 30616]